MFQTPPAKTPVTRENGNMSRWEYREVYPTNSMTGNYATLQGREATFNMGCAPGEWIIPSQCRILMKVRVKRTEDDHAFVHSTSGGTTYQSLRFQACPTAAMWSSARFSSSGNTIEAITHVHDTHVMRRRLRALPGVKNGTLSLENFDQRMHHREQGHLSTNVIESANGNIVHVPDELRNEKQRLITESVPPAVEHIVAGSSTYEHASVGNALATDNTGSQMKQIEVAGAIPLSCFDQSKALPYGSYELRLTVSSTAAEDALFTEYISAQASGSICQFAEAAGTAFFAAHMDLGYGGGAQALAALTNVVNQGNLCRVRPPVEAWTNTGTDKLEIFVSDIKVLMCVARPQRDTVPRPSSWQISYDRLQLFARTMTAASTSFSENFVIPPSSRLLLIDLAPEAHALATNRELSALGRDISHLEVTWSGKVLPAPAYTLDMRAGSFSAARAYNDFLDVVGADVNNPVSALSYSDWCRNPIFGIRLLGESLEASNNVQIRINTHAGVGAGTSLRVFTASTVVWEQEGFTAGGATEQRVDEVVG